MCSLLWRLLIMLLSAPKGSQGVPVFRCVSVLEKGPWISSLQVAAVDVINTLEYNARRFTVHERLIWKVVQVTEFYLYSPSWMAWC